METLTAQAFSELPLGDAILRSIGWRNEGRDMVVKLDLADHRTATFVFEWVDHLRIGIQQTPLQSNQPLSWGGEAQELESGRMCVLFDFAHQGEISLECNGVRAEVF